jgi:hypothetical protein
LVASDLIRVSADEVPIGQGGESGSIKLGDVAAHRIRIQITTAGRQDHDPGSAPSHRGRQIKLGRRVWDEKLGG